ncbi:uncharacterized protein LOC123297410 [Chrysoperla carnea]|uniref:uncharacterized protein LOC123297410 n=1 Tax=Chrysoperla carnea TaxID=189513 RepID=UPI001D0881A4|nr:uncharacterized protein LOC123297410 [Chrysoperla carnea]
MKIIILTFCLLALGALAQSRPDNMDDGSSSNTMSLLQVFKQRRFVSDLFSRMLKNLRAKRYSLLKLFGSKGRGTDPISSNQYSAIPQYAINNNESPYNARPQYAINDSKSLGIPNLLQQLLKGRKSLGSRNLIGQISNSLGNQILDNFPPVATESNFLLDKVGLGMDDVNKSADDTIDKNDEKIGLENDENEEVEEALALIRNLIIKYLLADNKYQIKSDQIYQM